MSFSFKIQSVECLHCTSSFDGSEKLFGTATINLVDYPKPRLGVWWFPNHVVQKVHVRYQRRCSAVNIKITQVHVVLKEGGTWWERQPLDIRVNCCRRRWPNNYGIPATINLYCGSYLCNYLSNRINLIVMFESDAHVSKSYSWQGQLVSTAWLIDLVAAVGTMQEVGLIAPIPAVLHASCTATKRCGLVAVTTRLKHFSLHTEHAVIYVYIYTK